MITPFEPPPRVSIVMCVHNEERYLEQTIESILTQSFADFELVVVDDGSTDGTRRILSAVRDARLRVLRHEWQGIPRSRNRADSLARGEYIVRHDGDDLSLPERLENQIRFLDEHPNIGIVGTYVDIIDADGESQNPLRLPTDHQDIVQGMLSGQSPGFIHGAVTF